MKLPAWLAKLPGRLLGTDDVEWRPRPTEWNKTLDDLSAENRSLSGEEMEWARQYEREQLRGWARFPKHDECFEALREMPVTYILHWRNPYASGGTGTLAKGERIRVGVHAHVTEPLVVDAMPLEEQRFAERFIPEVDRLSSNYGGYSLSLKVDALNRDFRLV